MKSPASSDSRHRRRTDGVGRERTSVSLPSHMLETIRQYVRAGGAENLSAFVEAALTEKLQRAKRDALYATYEVAARDEQFREDMKTVTEEFRHTEDDGL